MTTIPRKAWTVAAAAALSLAVAAPAAAGPTGITADRTTAATAGHTDASDGALKRFHEQPLHWQSCALGPDDELGKALDESGARCADVTVPLDYSDPEGRTITVAVARREATADAGRRLGPLLLNGGGPGGTGIDMILPGGGASEVADRFDLIGMDPRFVGRSTPLDCEWPVGSWIEAPGKSRADFRRSAARMRDLAERCARTEGDVMPHATTRNTARDMDVIRAALGAERISYLGYSYGTYLGQVYTQLFPGRTDRVVLDGVIDPADYSPRLLQGTAEANEKALRDWAQWAAERDSEWGLGASRKEVLATVHRIVRASAKKPLRIGETYRVDHHTVPVLLFILLSSDRDEARAALAGSVQVMAEAAERKPVEPTPVLDEVLNFTVTGAASHYGSVQAAIVCGDVAAPRDLNVYWRDIQRSRAKAPLFGPLTNNVSPCAFGPSPVEKPTVIDNDIPALLVSATGDTRTVHPGALAVRDMWPSSRLITLEGANHHGVYGEYGSECVDGQVEDYLISGELPDRDTVCPA
ncbi:alpha/beta fold hydrolase [Streptomyces sodiiphilus]